MSFKLILATHNRDKRDELRSILEKEMKVKVEVLTLDDIIPAIGDIEETGATLEENALIKAREVHRLTNLPTIADDTGLEVEALDGAPGVYSARFSGPGATYASNVKKLLTEMSGKENRTAQFTTVIAYIDERGRELLFEGDVKGTIALEARGTNGFGYDPVFIPRGTNKTFAELSTEEKNSLSHRGNAMREFATFMHSNAV